jgi:hypothetical protein
MTLRTILLLGFAAQFGWLQAHAHPASGIVVDPEGQVLFIHSRHGVCKVDTHGTLSYIHATRGGHWMCLDTAGVFSRTQPKEFERISPPGVKPAIIFADGGAPIAVNRDGNLYYGSGDDMSPGGLTVTRLSVDGKRTLFAPALKIALAKIDEGVTGLAAGPDGTLYVASASAIFKVAMDGTVSTLVNPVVVPDCSNPADPTQHPPYLRGLAVDADNTVYVAATSCRRVLKVSPQGRVETIMISEPPWSPTGVAVFRGEVYVLECDHALRADEYAPRVRKLGRDGTITTLVNLASAPSRLPP